MIGQLWEKKKKKGIYTSAKDRKRSESNLKDCRSTAATPQNNFSEQ